MAAEAREEQELGLGQGKEEEMKPWEQHSAVISIPRYDYRAPSSLLDRSHSGFLITCPIKREKSATKEAISILEKYVEGMYSNGLERIESCGTNIVAKKRKICAKETEVTNVESALRNDIVAKEASCPSSDTCESAKSSHNLSLVKLTRSGLLLFTFPSNDFRHVVGTLSKIFLSLVSGDLKRPLWCHRIFPVQETCSLIEDDLQAVVSKLVKEYLGDEQDKLEKPIKFAVGYNRRGIEETEMKALKSTVEDSKGLALLDRDICFKVVAGAFKGVAKNAVVDLKSPEVAVLVEVLPVSGLPHESLVVGVSVLPHDLITTKPRLCVKTLVSDSTMTERRAQIT